MRIVLDTVKDEILMTVRPQEELKNLTPAIPRTFEVRMVTNAVQAQIAKAKPAKFMRAAGGKPFGANKGPSAAQTQPSKTPVSKEPANDIGRYRAWMESKVPVVVKWSDRDTRQQHQVTGIVRSISTQGSITIIRLSGQEFGIYMNDITNARPAYGDFSTGELLQATGGKPFTAVSSSKTITLESITRPAPLAPSLKTCLNLYRKTIEEQELKYSSNIVGHIVFELLMDM